jgi:radical SAM superfamily enzyme YgiQ (UPF0313 family)
MRALLINPKFPESYWDLSHSLPILGIRYWQPPLPLLTVAALLPTDWSLRVIDENIDPVTDEDILAADIVMLTGMIVQRDAMWVLLGRCRDLNRPTVVGGPYVTSTPESVPADHIVQGEGEEVIPRLAADLQNGSALPRYIAIAKPSIAGLKPPRYDLIDVQNYGDLAIQFSRGCPFLCEFCDIISLYGRVPRTKTIEQVTAELDALYKTGFRGEVHFVDDNFIGNKKLVKQVLPEIAKWQCENGTPFNFYTEASVNLAEDDKLIDLMIDAGFKSVFIGIETPSQESLKETRKVQNLKIDLIEALHHVHKRGMMVMAGFILGFDNEGPNIFQRMIDFVERSGVSMAMVGQLVAVPRTPLYDRLKLEGRLRDIQPGDAFGPTNIVTIIPPRQMATGFRQVIRSIYSPSAYYDRVRKNLDLLRPRGPDRKLRAMDYARALRSMWAQGVKSNYRTIYWKFLFWALTRHPGKLRFAILESIYGHHFIVYSNETVVPRLGEIIEQLPNTEHSSPERIAVSA